MSIANIENHGQHHIKLYKERFDLKDLIYEIIEDYGFKIYNADVTIKLSNKFDDHEVLVEADRIK